MFSGMTYEELNELIENPRSEPYDEYFEVMDIPEEDKKKRIALAEKLEDGFLFALVLMFTMRQYDSVDWDVLRNRFETSYFEALSNFFVPSEDARKHMKQFSYDVIDSSQRHEDDPFYYSRDRAMFMAENESNLEWSNEEFIRAIGSGKTMKKWVDVRDKKERKTHRKVGGTVKPIQEPFLVGDSLMMFARDESMGAEAKEIISCRCTTKYF